MEIIGIIIFKYFIIIIILLISIYFLLRTIKRKKYDKIDAIVVDVYKTLDNRLERNGKYLVYGYGRKKRVESNYTSESDISYEIGNHQEIYYNFEKMNV